MKGFICLTCTSPSLKEFRAATQTKIEAETMRESDH